MVTTLVQKYTWREHWVFPYESLWSLVNKFGKLNWVSGLEIKNLFRCEDEEECLDERGGIGKWNFHGGKGFDLSKISHILNLPEKLFKQGITSTLHSKRDIHLLTEAKKLRYCPLCISIGYHSVVHQIRSLEVCPIHDVKLIDKCLHCKKDIPYDLHNSKHFYGCSFCAAGLLTSEWNLLSESERYNEVMHGKEKLDATFEWFCTMKKIVVYPNIERKYFEKADETMDWWGDMVLKKSPEFLKITQENKVHRSLVLLNISDSSQKVVRFKSVPSFDNPTCVNQKEFKYIYKAIRRYISKSLKNHKIKCHTTKWSTKPACSLGKAFKAWRLYWEKETKPREVLWIHSILNADLGKAGLNKKVAERVFALECYWTFEDCITHSNTLDYEYLWGNKVYKKYPFWTIEKDEARLIFHSWTVKGVLTNLVKGQCPACMCNHTVEALVA